MEEGDMRTLKQGKPYFIAFNYYTSQTVGESTRSEDNYSHTGDQHEIVGEPGAYRGSVNKNLRKTEFGWEIDPVGFRTVLRELYSRYHLPLIVTENGLGAFDKLEEEDVVNDPYRINFLQQHIEQIPSLLQMGLKSLAFVLGQLLTWLVRTKVQANGMVLFM